MLGLVGVQGGVAPLVAAWWPFLGGVALLGNGVGVAGALRPPPLVRLVAREGTGLQGEGAASDGLA